MTTEELTKLLGARLVWIADDVNKYQVNWCDGEDGEFHEIDGEPYRVYMWPFENESERVDAAIPVASDRDNNFRCGGTDWPDRVCTEKDFETLAKCFE